jgi:hypothetical protein
MAVKIQFRRDSAGAWSSVNPVMAQGELGLDLTNNYFKIGNGDSAWNSLPTLGAGIILPSENTTFTGIITYDSATTYNALTTYTDSAVYTGESTYNGATTYNGIITYNNTVTYANTITYSDSVTYDSDVTYNGANTTYTGANTTYTGAITYSAGATIVGDTNFNGPAAFNDSAQFNSPSSFNDTLKIHEIIELADIDTTAWPTKKNFDLKNFAVFYNTDSADANITANIRADSATKLDSAMSIGESMTAAILMTLGDSAVGGRKSITALTVDSNAVTPLWNNGNAPDSGASDSLNLYTYTVLKTAAATFTVIGNRTNYS